MIRININTLMCPNVLLYEKISKMISIKNVHVHTHTHTFTQK